MDNNNNNNIPDTTNNEVSNNVSEIVKPLNEGIGKIVSGLIPPNNSNNLTGGANLDSSNKRFSKL